MNSIIPKAFALSVFFATAVTDCCCDPESETTVITAPESYTTVYKGIEEYQEMRTTVFGGERLINNSLKPDTALTLDDQYTSLVIETRLFNGWSNMNDVILRRESTYSEGAFVDCMTPYIYSYTSSEYTTPPAMLHLLVDSIDDFSPGAIRIFGGSGKAWEFSSIVDENGADLSGDIDWTCFTDNEYIFQKSGGVYYEKGTIACEIDIPDRASGAWIPYSVTAENPSNPSNPGEITLALESGFIEGMDDLEFVIVSSDFDEVVLRYTNSDGEVGIITIVPEE